MKASVKLLTVTAIWTKLSKETSPRPSGFLPRWYQYQGFHDFHFYGIFTTVAQNNKQNPWVVRRAIFFTSLIVFLDNQSQKVVGKVVAEGAHGGPELVKVNRAALVLVESAETGTPFLNVLPQPRELSKVDETRIVYCPIQRNDSM